MCSLLLGLLLFAQSDTADFYYELPVKYAAVPDLYRIINKAGVVVWDSCRITEQDAVWEIEVKIKGKTFKISSKEILITEKNSGIREPLLLSPKINVYTVRRVKKK